MANSFEVRPIDKSLPYGVEVIGLRAEHIADQTFRRACAIIGRWTAC